LIVEYRVGWFGRIQKRMRGRLLGDGKVGYNVARKKFNFELVSWIRHSHQHGHFDMIESPRWRSGVELWIPVRRAEPLHASIGNFSGNNKGSFLRNEVQIRMRWPKFRCTFSCYCTCLSYHINIFFSIPLQRTLCHWVISHAYLITRNYYVYSFFEWKRMRQRQRMLLKIVNRSIFAL